MARVVADDEEDVARAAGVVARRAWRSRCRRPRRPGTAHDAETAQLPQSISPVAASASGRPAGSAAGVADGVDRGDLARAVAAVVAHPVDVEAVGRSQSVLTLKLTVWPLVDADVGGEALDARVAGAV